MVSCIDILASTELLHVEASNLAETNRRIHDADQTHGQISSATMKANMDWDYHVSPTGGPQSP